MKKKKYLQIDEKFLPYLREKGCNHRSYKMYSTIDIVNSIIENKALYLSSGYNWNDKVDRENFNNDKLTMLNFGRCFSYSTSESVAMWMLYGGMKHRGAMIEFDKFAMLEIIDNTKQIEVGYFEEGAFVSLKTLGKDKFKIQLIDVVYVEKKNNDFIVRRPVGDIWSIGTESNIFNNENYSFVHKSKAWDYEQECRLIVSIEKEKLKDLADYKKIQMIKIDIQGIDWKHVQRIYAPSVLSEEKEKLKSNEFKESILTDEVERKKSAYGQIKEFEDSILTGEVEWDLCLNCK